MRILGDIPYLNTSLTYRRFGFDISSMSAIVGTKQYLAFFDDPHGIIQGAYFTFPEICGKTIEEIELLFGKGGPKPWNTIPGGSRLDAEIQAVLESKVHGGPTYLHGELGLETTGGADVEEKGAAPEVTENAETT